MESISYKELNANLSQHLDAVVETGAPLVVKRARKKSVVLMPLDEFRSWQETAHLLSTPANAAALRESISQVRPGGVSAKDGDTV
jgi:antitoxin YefM